MNLFYFSGRWFHHLHSVCPMQAKHGVFLCQDETQNRNQTYQITNEPNEINELTPIQTLQANQHSTNKVTRKNHPETLPRDFFCQKNVSGEFLVSFKLLGAPTQNQNQPSTVRSNKTTVIQNNFPKASKQNDLSWCFQIFFVFSTLPGEI